MPLPEKVYLSPQLLIFMSLFEDINPAKYVNIKKFLKKKCCAIKKISYIMADLDRWPSGRRRTIGNRVYL